MSCRHKNAYPTIIAKVAGFMWCPDCGAHRMIARSGPNGYSHCHRGWILPRGLDHVLKRLEKIDALMEAGNG